MNPLTSPPTPTTVVDEDLAEQARPGHGIPSQDPDPAAQTALEPHEAQREANSVFLAGGLVAGMATGAAIGAGVAGPAGLVAGGALGAVAGSLGGAAAGANTSLGNPTAAAPAPSVRLHIEDRGGSGRPVVLIHGWPLSAQAWAAQVPVLQAAGYRVVAYDRRGFGQSDKPDTGYSYDTLADDLQHVLEQCALQQVTLVGFSMGGGEVARYIARHGESRLHSVVFAAAVTPCLMQSPSNPDGPLTPESAQDKKAAFQRDRSAYFDQFTQDFFSAHGVLQVTESQRADTLALCEQSASHAALACMEAFATTDFREDLEHVTVPTLVIHGDADAVVPMEGSGLRTHRAVPHSQWVAVSGAPHGLNVSHPQAFNAALLGFLRG
ncbi:MAG: alpha/beta hydrolase [Hydrogenophaga sp.]|uniref:alpha/beta fold hydrolase n=1 Tax=Hydrogenophaga sp. TaxID=1904254 RepID=UPI00275810AE|nr:alpha/beta hydrolase [Hydrogenophaga sp.]MDP2418196.1 alpha/beta hydrolase [Hydrogenophaga sp.]MDZ4188176.1 alpha/beta hydrolase [Hydrogenophaga sp.]